MNKIEFTVIDYRNIEKKIQAHFNRPDYNIVADEEWNNDSQHTYEDVNGEVDHPVVVEEFKAGRGFASFGLHHLLNQMVADGALAAGNYVIEVCW